MGSALSLASYLGCEKIVKILLSIEGTQVNSVGIYGATPLMAAAVFGQQSGQTFAREGRNSSEPSQQ